MQIHRRVWAEYQAKQFLAQTFLVKRLKRPNYSKKVAHNGNYSFILPSYNMHIILACKQNHDTMHENLAAGRRSSPSASLSYARDSWARLACWPLSLGCCGPLEAAPGIVCPCYRVTVLLGRALKTAQRAGLILFLFNLDSNMLQTLKICRDLNSSKKIMK
jgi:hypothetical protein